MILVILAATDTGSVVVAVAIVISIGTITIVAMLKYDIDAALKMWAALGTVTGLVVGSMGTYFFTKDQLSTTSNALAATRTALTASEKQKAQAADQIQWAVKSLKPYTASQEGADQISKLEDVSKHLKPMPAANSSRWLFEDIPEPQPRAASSP